MKPTFFFLLFTLVLLLLPSFTSGADNASVACNLSLQGDNTILLEGKDAFVQLCRGLSFRGVSDVKQGEPYTIALPVKNNDYSQSELAYCNFTIVQGNGTRLISNAVGNFTAGKIAYNLSREQTSINQKLRVDVSCNNNLDSGFSSFSLLVSGAGDTLDNSDIILYAISFILLSGAFALCLVFAIKLPWNNATDEEGNIISVNDLKYLKLALWWATYVLLIAIFYLAWNLTYGYLQFQGAANIIYSVYWILISFFYPITVCALLVALIRFVYDKRIKKAIDSGLQGIPA